MKRQMKTPESWIGKRVKHLDWDRFLGDFYLCDDCQRFFHADGMHALLWPMSEADAILQGRLGVEEAQSFCPDCLSQIEAEADKIDPEWRKRQGLA